MSEDRAVETNFSEVDQPEGYVRPQLLDDFFKLMTEVESEDVVYTLETITERFGEDIAPFALGMTQNLAAAV